MEKNIILYFLYFIIYGFLGWVMETISFSIEKKTFVNRGFLNGPICPVYGIGMTIIILLLTPFENNLVELFILGGILATILEYFTGWILEKLFLTKWWDYSDKKFNIRGYICLENTFYWCVLSVLMIRVLQPYIRSFFEQINTNTLMVIASILLIVLIIDIFITISTLIDLRSRIKNLDITHNAFISTIEKKINESKALNKVRNYELNLGEGINEIKENLSNKTEDIELIKKLEELKDRYQRTMNTMKRQQRRLIKGYRGLSSRRFSNVIENIKKEIKNRKDESNWKGH